ncbi:MAG: YkgJ family cysteine cluster protein [Elainellaceae cyanobacterium]
MATWHCIDNCGACCYLAPLERPGLDEYLSAEELLLYLSLVGKDGWCIHFDRQTRRCGIYADRPRFCRVEPDVFQDMYGIAPGELDDFAIDCCVEQIEANYGDRSFEMARFRRAVAEPSEDTEGER